MEPRKQPIQRRAQGTVEEVLAAAAQVFESRGYAGGTTNRIAEQAGVSIGTLYQYFPNKEAVAVALVERHISDGMRRLDEWARRIVAEQHTLRGMLRILVEGMIELHYYQPRLQHILFEETPLPARVHEALLAGERDAVKVVVGLLRLYPVVRHPRLDEAATIVAHTIESLTHSFAAHPSQRLAREVFASELVEMFEAYLTRESPPPTGH